MLRAGQRLGKYRLQRRLVDGGAVDVYRAYDTVERAHVALKVETSPENGGRSELEREIQIGARLDHPNVLAFRNADVIDRHMAIAYPLGERTLEERLLYRLSLRNALAWAEQLLSGLAHAHARRIVHRDVQPANLVLFPDKTLRITAFGLGTFDLRTKAGSSCGTMGYVAPEHAMGKPSARSDVFSSGLVIYRMITGVLPEWPYRWPLGGYRQLRRRAPEFEQFFHQALAMSSRRRHRDAMEMQSAFDRARDRVLARLDG